MRSSPGCADSRFIQPSSNWCSVASQGSDPHRSGDPASSLPYGFEWSHRRRQNASLSQPASSLPIVVLPDPFTPHEHKNHSFSLISCGGAAQRHWATAALCRSPGEGIPVVTWYQRKLAPGPMMAVEREWSGALALGSRPRRKTVHRSNSERKALRNPSEKKLQRHVRQWYRFRSCAALLACHARDQS